MKRWLGGLLLLCALGAWGATLDGSGSAAAAAITPATLSALRAAWSVAFYQADPKLRFDTSACEIDAQGRIFIAARRTAADGLVTSTLCAYDAASGMQRWVVPVPNVAGAPQLAFDVPAAANGMVFAALDTSVGALVASSGQPLWRAEAGVGAVRALYPLSTELLVVVGETGMTALTPQSGALRWKSPLRNAGRPLLDGKKLYVAADAGLHLLDANTGAAQTLMSPAGATGTALLMRNGVLFYAAPAAIYAINTATKKMAWKYPLPGPEDAPPAAVAAAPFALAGNLLCVADIADNRVFALQTGTGARVWETPCDGLAAGTPLAAATGLLFVADRAGSVLNPATGALLGKISPLCQAHGWRTLRLTPDATALVGLSTTGNLHVCKPQPPAPPARGGGAIMR